MSKEGPFEYPARPDLGIMIVRTMLAVESEIRTVNRIIEAAKDVASKIMELRSGGVDMVSSKGGAYENP